MPQPRFTPGTHWTGGWVGPRAGLDAEVRRKTLCLCRGSNPGRPVRSQTLYWLSYPGSLSWLYFPYKIYTAERKLVENLILLHTGLHHFHFSYAYTSCSVFWDVAPYSLVEVYRRFRGACCFHQQTGSTSKTSVNFYQTTRRNIPEDSDFHTRCRENLKSHTVHWNRLQYLWKVKPAHPHLMPKKMINSLTVARLTEKVKVQLNINI
jgi:hypothetical protein